MPIDSGVERSDLICLATRPAIASRILNTLNALEYQALPLPLLVFGGPYSNLQAVSALQAQACARAIPARQIVCTGDVVAYCADPEATVGLVREWGIHVVQGNCEEQLAVAAGDCGCGFEAGTTCDRLSRDWYEFANARLSPDSRRWMGGLPRTLHLDMAGVRARVVHGGVRQINRFLFASQHEALAGELASSGADLVIAGHCGIPFLRQAGGRAWFNPGVVGMPANDGTPRGWYGVIDVADAARPGQSLQLSVHPLDYDYAVAAAAVRAGGHADAYAEALVSGRWPSVDVLPAAERDAAGLPIAGFSTVASFERTPSGRAA